MQCLAIIVKEYVKWLLSDLQIRLYSSTDINHIGKETAEENKGIATQFYIKEVFLEYYLLFCTYFDPEQKEKSKEEKRKGIKWGKPLQYESW